ncbi:hypothetical protein DFH09DRAFT_1093519 [Mycena vulgaris]|nr:hypothetical protein DFH09DRAFT_1093519 [Mycena vulgaris]
MTLVSPATKKDLAPRYDPDVVLAMLRGSSICGTALCWVHHEVIPGVGVDIAVQREELKKQSGLGKQESTNQAPGPGELRRMIYVWEGMGRGVRGRRQDSVQKWTGDQKSVGWVRMGCNPTEFGTTQWAPRRAKSSTQWAQRRASGPAPAVGVRGGNRKRQDWERGDRIAGEARCRLRKWNDQIGGLGGDERQSSGEQGDAGGC